METIVEQAKNYLPVNATLSTSGSLSPASLQQLAAQGYELLINLLPNNNADALANEQDIVEALGLHYAYLPVDFAAPQLPELQAFSQLLNEYQGRKTHCHCAANYRATAFYACHAVQSGLWQRDEADAFMQQIWQPQQYPAWAAFLQQHCKPQLPT